MVDKYKVQLGFVVRKCKTGTGRGTAGFDLQRRNSSIVEADLPIDSVGLLPCLRCSPQSSEL